MDKESSKKEGMKILSSIKIIKEHVQLSDLINKPEFQRMILILDTLYPEIEKEFGIDTVHEPEPHR